jgi:hypothetical protein
LNLPSDLSTLSLEEVLRALGLDFAASQLDAASGKAIARNATPVSLLNDLMREQLRVLAEARAQAALRRAAIFPLTTLDAYDFNDPRSIDRELVTRAASLDFVRDKTNVVFIGPSGVGKTHLATPSASSPASVATASASSWPRTSSTTWSPVRRRTPCTAGSPPGPRRTCSSSTSSDT